MADSLVTSAAPAPAIDARLAASLRAEVLRDIARGGIAGIIVGFFVAGLGGRLVMRLATILHEEAVGSFTEAGEVIGHISVNGTVALMTFGGLGMGLVAGTIWVIVGPWMPGSGLPRAVATAIAAIALGAPLLVQRTNVDFVLLGHDPRVVALLVGLVGCVGFSIALVDDALDVRLPHPVGGLGIPTTVYLIVTVMGLVLILPLVTAILLAQAEYDAPIRAGWALAVVGACTLIWWVVRIQGRSRPPAPLRITATVFLLIALVLGVLTGLPHILSAAGMAS